MATTSSDSFSEALNHFKDGKAPILVATQAIEEGVAGKTSEVRNMQHHPSMLCLEKRKNIKQSEQHCAACLDLMGGIDVPSCNLVIRRLANVWNAGFHFWGDNKSKAGYHSVLLFLWVKDCLRPAFASLDLSEAITASTM